MTWKTAYNSIRTGGIVLLWVLALSSIAVNVLSDPFLSTDRERRLQQAVLLQPFDPHNHEALGAYYRDGNISAAQREYILAASLLSTRSGGTDTAAPVRAWGMYQQKQQQLVQEQRLWERVYEAVPDYQYAAVKLAQLSYQTGDLPGARKYFLIAREHVPWDPTVASLAAVLR